MPPALLAMTRMNYKILAGLYLMWLANNMAELHGPNPQHILAAAPQFQS